MAYKQKILSERPLGYWRLNELVSGQYPNLIDSSNAGFSYGGSEAIFYDVFPLVSTDKSDTSINACKVSSSVSILIPNQYNAFYKGYESVIFGFEFWIDMPENQTEDYKIFSVSLPGSPFKTGIGAHVYTNNDFVYFTVVGKDNVTGQNVSYTTKKQIFSWSEKTHIFVCYSEKSIYISANGLFDEVVVIPDTFVFDDIKENQTTIQIGPAPTSKYYSISDFAIYDRILSLNEIRSRMFWASVDSGPESYSYQGSTSYFPMKKDSGHLVSSRSFAYKEDYNVGFYNGLIADGSGLTLERTVSPGTLTGTWTYNYPIPYFTTFAGVNISWESASTNSKVYVSYDGGLSYSEVENGGNVPMFFSAISDVTSASLLIKAEIYSSDTSALRQPRIDNLSVKIYDSLKMLSDSGKFSIYPVDSSTYVLKDNDNTLLDKHENIGISFPLESGAIIQPKNGVSYRSIEFWYKKEGYLDIAGLSTSILATSSLLAPNVFVNESSKILMASDCTVYVNGSVPDYRKIFEGETYHICVVFNEDKTDTIKINIGEASNVGSRSSYGFITVMDNAMSQSDAQDRYLSYLTSNTQYINDGYTSLGSILEYTGTSSQINGGKPVISYQRMQ